MIITTGGKTDETAIAHAKIIADKYNCSYIERKKQSIDTLFSQYQTSIAIVGRNKITIIPLSTKEHIYFHPNLSMIRAKRLLKGEKDTFIEAAKLAENMSILDCTMGLAADSIIASLITKQQGKVTSIEANPLLYMLVTEGLKIYQSNVVEINDAMRRIQTIHADHHDYLKELPDNSYDIVYFDPMFQESIESSSAIQKINNQTLKIDIKAETIEEAKRVAKQRIVLKDHWKSQRFKNLGFEQIKRKTSQVHYGYIDTGN
ncbi:class I SAM-dependent methyltransferase [Salinicoccus sp. HZC-1]|uniref:class I SAM-dependent methyltransferase n=1 Tax=Salinicoccus sp. HZC-1 TaxID=3385497 RepID=UPI00398B3833